MQKTNKQKIRLLGSNKIYRGNISVRIDRFQLDKKMIKKEIIEHLPSVGIIPVRDDHNIIFVVQYRHATGKTMLEIPAGKIENDETPMQAAFREMAEEIGYTGNLAPLSHWYLAPGYSTEMMQIFILKMSHLKKISRLLWPWSVSGTLTFSVYKLKPFFRTTNTCTGLRLISSRVIWKVMARVSIETENL